MSLTLGLTVILACGAAFAGPSTLKSPESLIKPLIIGHRGASGHRPEHTLASYRLAIEMGADFIEPDLVMTKDGVLIARHENEISETTDAAEKFPARKKTKTIDGREVTGWFTEDLTLAEIKTLRAKERLSTRDRSHDGKETVPTFEEVLELLRTASPKDRTVGVYPEMKHPTYFRSIGLPLEPALTRVLKKHGLTKSSSPVIVQSFELESLRKIRADLPVRLVFLVDEASARPADFVASGDKRTYGDLMKDSGLRELRKTVDGIGPWKRLILPVGKEGKLEKPTDLIDRSHRVGLFVHPYTFRDDKAFLAAEYDGDPVAEYLQFFKLGVDGVFSDFPDTAVKARKKFRP